MNLKYIFTSFLFLFYTPIILSYENNIAKTAVNLSQASYCIHDYSWNCKTCDKDNTLEYIVENHGVRALIGYNTRYNNIFVAFRGSENILNWVDNIQIVQISPYYNNTIKVDKGFYKAYEYLKNELINKIKKITQKYNTKNIFLTGHSLGAAIATLLSYDILNYYDYLHLSHLITFGSPRVGNKYFVESFKKFNLNHYRITHNNDIVPHLPEEFFYYLHVPNEIWYDELNIKYTICNDTYYYEDDLCSNSCAPLNCISISDHLDYLNISLGKDGDC